MSDAVPLMQGAGCPARYGGELDQDPGQILYKMIHKEFW